MKRRSGISSKVSNCSGSCNYCRLRTGNLTCLLCQNRVCDGCICDQNKYCINCENQNLRKSTNTYIKVPIENGKETFLIVKSSRCCFM